MNRAQTLRRVPLLALLLALVLSAFPAPAQAQTPIRYFSQTGHYVRGAFRAYWERNGGLGIFGYPVTEEYTRTADGKIVQYFERARFELRVSNNQATVELGRLGAEITGIQQTVTSLGGGFRTFWQRNGGVAVFGNPLTNEYREAQPDGSTRTVQWFERSKFELAAGGQVQLALLGRLLAPPQLLAAWPANVAPGAPLNEDGTPYPPGGSATPGTPGTPGTPAVRVSPGSGNAGQVFTVQGEGFQPGEAVALWVTAPNGQVRPITQRPNADRAGSITSANVRFSTGGFGNGNWALTAQGTTSQRIAITSFTITGPVGDPGKLGGVLQTSLVPQGPGSVSPLAAMPGTAFSFTASNFDPSEQVGVWLTRPNSGGLESVNERSISYDGKGGIRVVVRPQNPVEGVWLVTAEGKSTKRSVTAMFKVTRDFFAPLGTARPANRNGAVSSAEGGQRTVFRLTGTGFRANEVLEHWVTTPDGSYFLNANVQADSRGRIGYSPGLSVQFSAANPTGVYGYHYRGTASGAQVDLYMTFTGAP